MSKLLPHHPLADLFPMIGGAELAAFIEDVKTNGLQRPILTTKIGRQTVIADGRTRQLACQEAGIEPRFQEWDGTGNLLNIICSLNCRSRNLSKTDRAVAAEAAIDLIDEPDVDPAVAKLQNAANGMTAGLTRRAEAAARLFEVSPRYVHEVRAIRRSHPAIYKAMRDRTINLSQAANRVERQRREKESKKKSEQAKVAKSALKLIEGDSIKEMDRLPAACATVIFADPPYNNKWKYDADPCGDDLALGEYLDWCQAWINSAVRLLAANGSMFVLIDDNNSDHLGLILRRSGLHRRNTVIWWETFGVHQTGNFSRCARYLHYYTARPKGFIWHPEPVESARQRLGDARANVDGKIPDNVWQIARVNGNDADRVPFEDAPPQVPYELPLRAIQAASEAGDLIIDPFNGNGTSGLAALISGRKYIGIDRSAKYLKQSEQWIKSRLADHKDGDK